ncbi:MAG: DUF2497 domain-containing protein [Alphaproteobacteria bacterium]|nr:DUF2497 domain-containing protein [Alphaproteobacteria bacterium]MBO7536866.1 DUF2497 domain-containing protein [Alphaproteobacteria bacterium]MBO7642268.1 DUF2497 domain-containing protein [Alphaproteobacteria bacterium]
MVEDQTEMSLDEMLSSIKQMVVDKDPPVLELTDMVSSDGTIVKLKNGQKSSKKKNELRDFLQRAQESGRESQLFKDSALAKRRGKGCGQNDNENVSVSECEFDSASSEKIKGLPKHTNCSDPIASDRAVTVSEIVREIAAPLIKDWLEKNLPELAKEIIAVEVQKMMKQN